MVGNGDRFSRTRRFLLIELEYTERLCYYVHGVQIENTPLPCLPAQANRAGRKTNAAPTFSYESSVSPISMDQGDRHRPFLAKQKQTFWRCRNKTFSHIIDITVERTFSEQVP